jgi:hypothetical protein
MFKRILTFGVAFGSVAGAFMFIHLKNYGADQAAFHKYFYIIFQFIIIPITAIYLAIKTYKRDVAINDNADLKPGNILMTGLFTSLILALVVSIVYYYINSSYPEIIENAVKYDTEMIDKQKEEITKALVEKKDERTFDEIKNAYLDQYKPSFQLRTNVFQFSSVGLLISGLMALVFLRRNKKKNTSN